MMLERQREFEQRRQAPLAQLTWLVAGLMGNKSDLEDWYTGFARAPEELSTGLTKELEADLLQGTNLRKVSQMAYEALKRVRD